MNKIKNVSNSAITINLPNVRYRTELRPKQERPLPDDVFMEFNYVYLIRNNINKKFYICYKRQKFKLYTK